MDFDNGICCSVVPLYVEPLSDIPLSDMPKTIITIPNSDSCRLILKRILFSRGYNKIKYRASSNNKEDTIYCDGKKIGLLKKQGVGGYSTVMKITFFQDNISIAIKIGKKRSIKIEHYYLSILNESKPDESKPDKSKPDETKPEYIIRSLSPCVVHNNLAAIIMPCYYSDLACLIKSSVFKSLGKDHIKCILLNIFEGLKQVHCLGIIHGDLKPANILINCNPLSSCITDFGLAQKVSEENLDTHVSTRPYRAPEIISCSDEKYSLPADIWSVGCILYELVTGEVLFKGYPCGNLSPPKDQTASRIPLDVKGGVWDLINKEKENHQARSKLCEMKNSDPDLVDLFNQCIEFDQNDRITAQEALNHRYFAGKL
jgi:serine/threonine protein kinase